ncbi:alpha/beta hydrolase [Brevundimonas sp. M20]|uniref:alpha/beta hydrolase n=1 Tax=Brevundimonas sp. M20 TaxID=2591463 RepID=UPI001F0E3DD4|nr:alpha/beta hydrolase [Brevundimonas sp. M20]
MRELHRRTALMIGLAAAFAAGTAAAQDRPRRGDRRRRRADRAVESGRSNAPHTSISTGSDPKQAYDLYAGAGTGPVLAYIHGGGWSMGDKAMVHSLPEYAQRHGLTLASIGYRLVPQVTPREQAQDVAAAVVALKRTHPGRPLFLMGHSAGAHLAALVGADPTYLAGVGLQPSDLAGVILLDGAGYDATGDRGNGPAGRLLGNLYSEAFGDNAAALSPTLLVRAGVRYPPYLIFYISSRDDARGQSEALAAALTRAGGQAQVIVAPDDSHRDINVEFGQAGDAEGERAVRFILGR